MKETKLKIKEEKRKMKTRKASYLCIMVTVMALGLVAVGSVGVAAESNIRIRGTDGDDTIWVNEESDFIWVNSVPVEPEGYDGAGEYRYDINTGKGYDLVFIYDDDGNDIYVINTGQDDDYVNVYDGSGNDIYVINTGQGNDLIADISDWTGNDQYIVRMGKGNDELTVSDDSTKDNYDLDGGPGDDSLYLWPGLTKGPPPSEGEGGKISIGRFEYVGEIY